MKRCVNCKHYFTRDICGFCELNGTIEIKHPFFMGKKCECYEKRKKENKKFEYPKKEKR